MTGELAALLAKERSHRTEAKSLLTAAVETAATGVGPRHPLTNRLAAQLVALEADASPTVEQQQELSAQWAHAEEAEKAAKAEEASSHPSTLVAWLVHAHLEVGRAASQEVRDLLATSMLERLLRDVWASAGGVVLVDAIIPTALSPPRPPQLPQSSAMELRLASQPPCDADETDTQVRYLTAVGFAEASVPAQGDPASGLESDGASSLEVEQDGGVSRAAHLGRRFRVGRPTTDA